MMINSCFVQPFSFTNAYDCRFDYFRCRSLGWQINHLDLAPRYASVLVGITTSVGTVAGIVNPILVGWMTDDQVRFVGWMTDDQVRLVEWMTDDQVRFVRWMTHNQLRLVG